MRLYPHIYVSLGYLRNIIIDTWYKKHYFFPKDIEKIDGEIDFNLLTYDVKFSYFKELFIENDFILYDSLINVNKIDEEVRLPYIFTNAILLYNPKHVSLYKQFFLEYDIPYLVIVIEKIEDFLQIEDFLDGNTFIYIEIIFNFDVRKNIFLSLTKQFTNIRFQY